MSDKLKMKSKIIITIIKKGQAKKVIKASREAGAEGGTVLIGKGTGRHDKKNILGIVVDREKEIILTLIDDKKVDRVLGAIVEAGKLNKPGYGVSFVVNLKQVEGIVHLLRAQKKSGEVEEG